MILHLLLFMQAATAAPPPPPTPRLGPRIRAAIASSPVPRAAFWGVEIADVQTSEILYSSNADHFFVPASNAKLFTTALGLMRLGPEFRVRTQVTLEAGNLVIRGAGDPNLSGREIPYRIGSPPGDPLAAIEDLASQIQASGLREVPGDVIGDDTAFIYQPYPEGWQIDEAASDDAAPVSALALNDNEIDLFVSPGAIETDPAVATWNPAVPVFDLSNEVLTDSRVERDLHFERLPGSTRARIWGTIPRGDPGQTFTLGVDDPARYTAMALRAALIRNGITVSGEARALHRLPGSPPYRAKKPVPPIAIRVSSPLIEDLRITDKVSQNLHAEMLLLLVAHEKTDLANRENGLIQLRDFLVEAGVPEDEYTFTDGSGLSRLDLVTPHAVTTLLRYMAASPQRDNWISLLPISGVDGTLSSRFATRLTKGHIRAKTGSLTHVAALSGYLERRDGRLLAFSILVNNFNGPASDIRAIIDRICSITLE